MTEVGFTQEAGTGACTAHVIAVRGRLTAEQMAGLADLAARCGCGRVDLDTQQSVQIPGIAAEDAPAFAEAVRALGLETGGCGKHIRPVSACRGSECRHGMFDVEDMARAVHERFVIGWREQALPAKFKIGVGGCPNNCAMPNLCDIGIVGAPGGFRLLLGGRGGRRLTEGRPVERVFATKEEVLEAVENALRLYLEQGGERERFGSMIERLGFDEVCARITAR